MKNEITLRMERALEKICYDGTDPDGVIKKCIEEEKEKVENEIIGKRLIYEDEEKTLPGLSEEIKIVERKIVKPKKIPGLGPTPGYVVPSYRFIYKEPNEHPLVSSIRAILIMRRLTNDRFPSLYTATHAIDGNDRVYLEPELLNYNKLIKEFDKFVDKDVPFPLWVLSADLYCGLDGFVFGKNNLGFKKKLEENTKNLISLERPDETKEEILSHFEITTCKEAFYDPFFHGYDAIGLILAKYIEKIDKEICRLGEEEYIREKAGTIAALMHYNIPAWTKEPCGRRITILSNVKWKDAEMYINLFGEVRDSERILYPGPKIIFFK